MLNVRFLKNQYNNITEYQEYKHQRNNCSYNKKKTPLKHNIFTKQLARNERKHVFNTEPLIERLTKFSNCADFHGGSEYGKCERR